MVYAALMLCGIVAAAAMVRRHESSRHIPVRIQRRRAADAARARDSRI